MAPAAGGKRKRVERSWSGDSGNNDGTRPSPHRPGNLDLAQRQQNHQPQGQNRDSPDSRPRGGRRGSRNNNRRNSNSRRGSETFDSQSRGSPPSSKAMSPPARESREPGLTPQPNGTPAPTPFNAPAPPPTTTSHKSVYAYEYVTQECLENWTSTGKESIRERGGKARTEEDAVTLASIFQEIIQSVFDGRLSVTEGGAAVNGIIGESSEESAGDNDVQMADKGYYASSLFLDTLSVLTDSDTTRPTLRPFVVATGISPSLMRQQLDTPLLQSLGLIRDTFARMGIRKQTNLLYRQSNYNLLREESEGYSKLLTELFTTSNNEPPASDVVEDTFERVKAMIGAFDMDVGRVLDVTLDVFAAVLVKQYRFFVKLLRASSWWPKEDELLRRCGGVAESGLPKWALPGSSGWLTTDEDREEALRRNEERDRVFWDRVREVGIRAFFEIGRQRTAGTDRRKSMAEDEGDETQRWMEETGTLPPKGNRVAAQLLGFKLRFYSSKTRDASDTLPDNLIYLAALLIKIGFISLRDLYPHLWRPDDSMDVLKEEKMQEKAQREKAARPGGGAMNALMMAGALADDTIPFPRTREADTRAATPAKEQEADKTAAKAEDKDALPEPADQKVLLLKSLLAIGALPESLYILGKFPWLLDAYPELPEYIHRILHHCLSKIAGPLRPAASRKNAKCDKKLASPDQTGMPKGKVRLGSGPPRRVLRWALLDKEDTNDGTDYRFYWDDWTDNIPVCQSVDDVFALCGSLLNLSGVKIGQDPTLLVKLARIGKNSLREDGSEANLARWRDLCKRLLVPSLSLTKANPGVVSEVFELLGNFSREERYTIYAEWYSGQISRLPDVKSAFDQARAETKDALKRLSKTNIRPMARTLAKIAYANPGIVIHVAISQIESYENLIEVVVECARYFTYLGYDILTWSLINSLGQKGRSRVQESGLLTSRWLNALATFVGRVFKRYCSIMDPNPVLQYVGEQLRRNNSTDLIVLEQLISSMAGIVTDTNFNDAQIQAMAGGDLLRSQTMLQLLDKRHESKTSSKRLMKSLTDSKLAGQLLVAIAQERLTCIFKQSEAESELKLLGNIFDEIHRVLTQYLDLLRTNFTLEEFEASVPKLGSLIGDFGIQPEVAFWITRPNIAHKISLLDVATQESAAKKTETDSDATPKVSDNDVEMIDEGEATEKENIKSEEVTMVDDSQPKSTEADSEGQSSSTPATTPKGDDTPPWNPVIEELMETIKSAMPQTTWEVVGLPFYVTFWQLSLYDIHVPQRAYEDELERQKKKVIAIQNDRTDISMAGTQRKEREKKQINELHDRILDENKRHLRSYGQTRSRLLKEKDRWFVGMRGKHDALNIAIMEQCFLPRLLLSPMDAFYCFKMLKYLHSSGTPNFRTLGLLDQLFRDQRLTAIIFQCTSKEADNFGRFLNEVLRDLGRWHADKAVYEKEAYGTKKDLPGFSMAMDPEGKPTAFLDYEDFRRILYKWHRFLSNALKTCLSGGEYMHIRNAISVLKAIVQHFPAVNWIGKAMHECVNTLKTSDPRDDVKIPAASLIGDLNRREKKWMLPQAFMVMSKPPGADTPKNEQAGDKTSTGKMKTPQPQSRSATPKPLNAAAAEFKPTEAANKVNGDEQTTGKPEIVEDGEIEDAKMTDAPKEEDQKPAEVAESARDKPEKLPETSKSEKAEAEKQTTQVPTDKTASKEAEPSKSSESKASPEARQSAPPSQPQADGAPSAPRSSSPSQSRTDNQSSSEAPNQPNIPKRPDFDRHPASSPAARPSDLPSKPEPIRPFRHTDARGAGRDMPDTRQENRHPDHHRPGRHGAQDRDRALGHPADERGRERDRLNPPRGDRDIPPRQPQEDHYGRPRPSPREQERSDRSTRGRPQPDYFQPRQDPRDEGLHPSRLANIPPTYDRKDQSREHARGPPHPENALPSSRQEPTRPDRGDRRYNSRPPTPPRMEDNRPPNRMDRRDERDDRRSSNYAPPPPPPPPRRDEPPTGPRSDRVSRPSSVDGHPPDARQTQPPPSPDLSYGRLNQEPSGRPQEIPSGPRRGAQGRGGRNASVSQSGPAPPQSQGSPVRPTDRQPPSGPSNRSRNAAQADQKPPAPSAAPPALDTLDTSGIHPDRLKALQAQTSAEQPPSSPASMGPPSGPRSAGYPPTGPASAPRGPSERGRGDKRFVGINNMLQQSSGMPSDRSNQGASIRGRAGNRPGSSQPSTSSPQSTQSHTPSSSKGDTYSGSAAAGPGSPRADLFSDRPNGRGQQQSGPPSQDREEPRGSGRSGRRGELIDEAAAESRRSRRNSSSGTRTPDADRDRDRERDRDRDRDRDRRRDRDREQDRDRDRDRGGSSRRVDDDDSKGAGSKRDDGRERARDSDRQRDRDRGRARDTSRERTRESRESSSRRDAQPSTAREAPSSGRRDRRDREEAPNPLEARTKRGRSPQGHPAPPPPPPPPPPPFPAEDRRWSGRNEDRNRDRERERDRDRGRDRRDAPPGPGPAGGGGTWPRKRGRTANGGDDSYDQGGTRVGSESKRPRRGR